MITFLDLMCGKGFCRYNVFLFQAALQLGVHTRTFPINGSARIPSGSVRMPKGADY